MDPEEFWIEVEPSDTGPISDFLFGRWYWRAGEGYVQYDSGFAYTRDRAYAKAERAVRKRGAVTFEGGPETVRQTQIREWDEAFTALERVTGGNK